MKHILVLIAFLGCLLHVDAQNIKVTSFQLLPTDLSARTAAVKDLNGDECALIKIVTSDPGYSFSDIIKQVNKPNEIWIYVPQGSKRITIRHPKYGILRNYEFDASLSAKTTYEMKMLDNIEVIIHEDAGGQYLVMNVKPADATVYIDGVPEVLNNGVLSKLLKYGQHSYKIEAPLYQPSTGEVLIENERKNLSVELKPDFGFIQINSTPEQGASVYIDDVLVGKTPLKSGRLSKGVHQIRAVLPMYKPLEQAAEVIANQSSTLLLNFAASFAKVELQAQANEEIWVNNERKGTGVWSGRLTPGLYTFEARRTSYRSSKQTIELKAGDDEKIVLGESTPIRGSLNINTVPADAKVSVDGKDMGVTPNIFSNILAGKRTIEISKPGCLTKVLEVNIREGIVEELNVTLPVGQNVTLSSNMIDAQIYVDQKLLGASPVQTSLSYASHTIVVKSPQKNITRTVVIDSSTPLVLEFNDLMLGKSLGGGWYEGPDLKLRIAGQTYSGAGYGYREHQRAGCIIGHSLFMLYKSYAQKILPNGGRDHQYNMDSFVEYDLETGTEHEVPVSLGGSYKLGVYNGKMILFSPSNKLAYVYADGRFRTSIPYTAAMKEVTSDMPETVSNSFSQYIKSGIKNYSFAGKGYYFIVRNNGQSENCYFYIPPRK